MSHLVVRMITAVACLGVHALASAADTLYAYDGFNYAIGSALAGQAGGSGWSGAWASSAGGSGATVVGGLTYTDGAGQALRTMGGAIRTNASVFFSQEVRDTTQAFGAAGSAVWVSFLVQQAADPNAGTSYAQAALGTGLSFGSNAMNGGLSGGNVGVGAFYSGTEGQLGNASLPAGSVSFIVLRFDFSASGNDTINLWLNPLLSGVSATPDLSGAYRDYPAVFSGLTLASGDFRAFAYDELRIGSSYAAVTSAVPQPQSLALLLAGLGGVATAVRRRTRAV